MIMYTKGLGKTKEQIAVIGQGTWKMGKNEAEEIAALKAGIKAGMNFIDTAEMYGSERVVGEAIKGEEVFVATKVSPSHFGQNDVIKACDQSLKNLGIKTIDLYQLHWPNPMVPISETIGAMEKLVKAGKIRYIGISNFSVEQTKEAQEALKSNEIVSNQVEYNLLARDIENELLDYCGKEHITVIAYSPFAQGKLISSKNKERAEALSKIAKKHNATEKQVMLNWLISKKPVVAIPKAANREHALENAAAADFTLSDEELKEISDLF
jgi:diketogulonate reductase-like aldo/keto reductase